MKQVYIVLTKTNTILARFIRFMTGCEYSHASISMDAELTRMYSFSRKYVRNPFFGGFMKECPGMHVFGLFKDVPCAVIAVQVSESQYEQIEEMLRLFKTESERYGYNYFGLLHNLLKLQQKSHRSFFCSEFVYHVLYESRAVNLGLQPCQVRPQDLLFVGGKLVYRGNLNTIPQTGISLAKGA